MRLWYDHERQPVEVTFELQLVATSEQLGWESGAPHAPGAVTVEPYYDGESYYSVVAGAGDEGKSLSLRENLMTSSDDDDAVGHSSVG